MRTSKLRLLKRIAIEESGAAAVEFALVSTAFITLVFGITYLGIMLHTKAALQWAVETTIRKAAINTTVSQSTLTSDLNGYLSTLGLPTATVSYNVVSGAIPVATLTGSFSQTYVIPYVSTFNVTYSATAKVPQGS
jgi:Flp pilus assembly protein TadG